MAIEATHVCVSVCVAFYMHVCLCVCVCEVAKLKKLFACKFVVRIGKRKRKIIKAKAKKAGETLHTTLKCMVGR